MDDDYVILHGNATIFGMDKMGVLREVLYLLDNDETPFEILTDAQWKERMKAKHD